jgi:hypothetical protein
VAETDGRGIGLGLVVAGSGVAAGGDAEDDGVEGDALAFC